MAGGSGEKNPDLKYGNEESTSRIVFHSLKAFFYSGNNYYFRDVIKKRISHIKILDCEVEGGCGLGR